MRLGQAAGEPHEGDAEHQPARSVPRAARPREEAGADERPAEQEPEHRVDERRVLVAAEDERERDPTGGHADGQDSDPRPPAQAHLSRAVSAAAESSAFGTKPRAPLRSTSPENSVASRLEVRTTAGDAPFHEVSRAATSNPSMPGSCTSSSTTSGWSRAASSSAVSPSSASPTTSNPSASSSARAVTRKLGWSSTMRTVGGMPGMLASIGSSRHTASRTLVDMPAAGMG